MNGDGDRVEEVKMEEKEASTQRVVYMWGYLPGALPQRSPLLSPTTVRLPPSYTWMDVCGGGCGFAMAISGDSFYLCFSLILTLVHFVVFFF